MLDLKEIGSFYPEYLRPFKKNLLREYLQCKILEIIFSSKFGGNLCFMGGTAVHLIHANTRFSEDLDFDNQGLNKGDVKKLTALIRRKLGLEGYAVEIKNVFKKAYCVHIKIKNILFEYGISGHKQEKLLIKIDAEPQRFEYRGDKVILNRFDVFTRVNVVPVDILLSQKLYAIFNRKRVMGRDFYDAIFLSGKTRANMDYLKAKVKIKNGDDLKKKLLLRCAGLNFKSLVKDVEQFVFRPGDAKKILMFTDYVNSL